MASIGKNLAQERMKILTLLWNDGFKAEMLYDQSPKPEKQLKKALTDGIPLIVWIGESEI